jgi:hypothetical protein
MNVVNEISSEIDFNFDSNIQYSVCTLVSRKEEYQEMLNSFLTAGFSTNFTEFLYIDNSNGNKADAFKGLNYFLQKAKGKYIILCHQDILLNYHTLTELENCIKQLDTIDENWAILSNAGASGIKDVVYRLYEPNNTFKSRGNPIQKVTSVDEHFVLVKKSANLALSGNLNGFHLYGTDLCMIANILGYTAYVVEFHLLHKSKGNIDASFYNIKENLIKKYTSSFKGTYIQTTCTQFFISGSNFCNALMNKKFILFFVKNYISIRQKVKNPVQKIDKSTW